MGKDLKAKNLAREYPRKVRDYTTNRIASSRIGRIEMERCRF